MVHEVVPPTEPTQALLAFKRLLSLVDQHMSLELVAVREPGSTELASVGALARMYPQVTSQVGHLHKLTIAVCAVVWLLSSVQPHMSLEMVVTRETLVALFALERLLARVCPLVILKDVLVAETPITDATHEYLVPSRGIRRRVLDHASWNLASPIIVYLGHLDAGIDVGGSRCHYPLGSDCH